MGACLCTGHKDLQQPMTVLWAQTNEEEPSSDKEGQNPSNGDATDKSRYDIGELATSSLLGLVATIKDHITKPTAMAQGRVAHLIEWKGWSVGEGAPGGRSGAGWGRGGAGWGGMEAELQEDAHFYSQMTDEIKEARFAAGVAQQFALAEASMNVWPIGDGLDRPSTSLQVPHNHLLSQFLLDGGSMGVPQHLFSLHSHMHTEPGAAPTHDDSVLPTTSTQPQTEVQLEPRGPLTAEASVRHVDSSSLSEDDVFYN
ncbi:protein FAM131C [Eucyclogobius newberryi]|uniref:protein FAM131C n=1 Tax=Eucyclogobius newberryi TaxID=166745 RepID=UPI003B5C5C39